MEGVIGYTTLFAGNFAPKNWAFCQGQIMAIRANTALFSILGTVYGGDGKTTFALPDLQGRAVVSAGQGPGLSYYDLGEQRGQESNVLFDLTYMPPHTHPVQVVTTPPAATSASTPSPDGGVYATGSEQLFNPSADSSLQSFKPTISMQNTGSQQPFSILHPVLAMNYIICLQGVFPARN